MVLHVTLAIIVGAGFWFARGALVVGLAIPTSIVGTFLLLDMLGRSLNVVSLAGLAFAVGMLVDNAVVVLENIYRRYDELHEPPMTAAVKGTQEVWGAVLSSTLTTVAVFLPIVFIQEEAGQLFRDIAPGDQRGGGAVAGGVDDVDPDHVRPTVRRSPGGSERGGGDPATSPPERIASPAGSSPRSSGRAAHSPT